jgi:protein tyrosine/serine phosphatase
MRLWDLCRLSPVFNNFHVVVPSEVYRSAQPTREELEFYYNRYGIQTIVNLRGSNAAQPWHQHEAAAARDLGINLVDFGISAHEFQPPDKLDRLIYILAHAKKPILIHCNWGADRSGLASALYLAAVARKPELTAENQLSCDMGIFRFHS